MFFADDESGPRRDAQVRNDTLNVSGGHIEADPLRVIELAGTYSLGNLNRENSRGQIGFLDFRSRIAGYGARILNGNAVVDNNLTRSP